jgi:hypothetical protein
LPSRLRPTLESTMNVSSNAPRNIVLSAIAASLVLSACSAPTGSAPGPVTVHEVGTHFGHVHGVDLNPADGTVYAATHYGVFRLGPAGPERIADRYQDTMGFTIAGPDLFLGSGHPDPSEAGPPHLGLVTSTDRAQTWTNVALSGEADFHALSAAGATIYGFEATRSAIMRTDDSGQNWQQGARVPATDLDVDPADPRRVVATTESGLQISVDGGMTFSPVPVQPSRPLILLDHILPTGSDRDPRIVGVDDTGGVWAQAGDGWAAGGRLPGPPEAFTVITADQYLAATEEGVLRSEDAGRTWSVIAATSR